MLKFAHCLLTLLSYLRLGLHWYRNITVIISLISKTDVSFFTRITPRGEGYSTKFFYREALFPFPTLYPFIYHFRDKRYPFRIPSIDKWHPFHIPRLELCIPFNCCECNVFTWIDHKTMTCSRLFHSHKKTSFSLYYRPKWQISLPFQIL